MTEGHSVLATLEFPVRRLRMGVVRKVALGCDSRESPTGGPGGSLLMGVAVMSGTEIRAQVGSLLPRGHHGTLRHRQTACAHSLVPKRFAAHRGARLGRALDVCREPRAAAELLRKRFGQDVRVFQLLFPMGETIARMKRAVHHGRLARRAGQDGALRFVRATRDRH
jgi:hypothetical protein